MGKKEIKSEKSWLGERKQVVYENGRKLGEIKNDKITDEYGNKIGSIRHESGKSVIYDRNGNKLSETLPERGIIETLFGLPGKEGIYSDNKKIGELTKERSFFGDRFKLLHDEPGSDVEPLTRTDRERIEEEIEREREEQEEEEEWEEEDEEEESYEEVTPKPSKVDIIAQKLSDKNQTELHYIAGYDENPDVRRAATRKLTDQSELDYMSRWDKDSVVREAALERLKSLKR